MSRWAHEHPEQMAEIAALPPGQQNAAMRDAVGYDPDLIREQAEEAARDAPPPTAGAGAGVAEPERSYGTKPCWKCGGDGENPWRGGNCPACGGTGMEP